MSINIPAVLLTSGNEEKIKSLTSGESKMLLKLVGKHIIEHTLENLIKIGIRHTYIVSKNVKKFEDIAVKYGKYLEIELIEQKKPSLEEALLTIKEFITNDFMLIYGNIVAPEGMYRDLMSVYLFENKYSVVVIPEEEIEEYQLVVLNENKIEKFVEKLVRESLNNVYVVGGAYIFPKEFLEYVENTKNFFEALDIVNKKHGLKPCVWSGWWIQIEYPWDLLRACLYLLQQIDKSMISSSAKISPNAILEGPVIIEDDVEIDHFAVIKGPVYIGKKTYIGTYSLVRNYVSLEGYNVIGSFSEIVWSSIQRNTSIGSRSYIGFSVIGFNSVIEPGIVTLNVIPEEIKISRAIKITRRGREYTKLGAIIGSNTRVEAYKVIKPGEEIINHEIIE